MQPYLYIDHLAEVTPWTPSAIRSMMARGVLVKGTHYFKPFGARSRPIFSWPAIVALIEGGDAPLASSDTIALANGAVVDLHEATENIHRLRR